MERIVIMVCGYFMIPIICVYICLVIWKLLDIYKKIIEKEIRSLYKEMNKSYQQIQYLYYLYVSNKSYLDKDMDTEELSEQISSFFELHIKWLNKKILFRSNDFHKYNENVEKMYEYVRKIQIEIK